MMSTMTEERMSDYTPGKPVRTVAREWLSRYQNDDDINQDAVYGIAEVRVMRFTLAGGGPSFFVDFEFHADDEVWDGDPLRATATYSEGWGVSESMDLGADDAAHLWHQLTRDSDEDGE
jgi:hypothetical protein